MQPSPSPSLAFFFTCITYSDYIIISKTHQVTIFHKNFLYLSAHKCAYHNCGHNCMCSSCVCRTIESEVYELQMAWLQVSVLLRLRVLHEGE